MWQGMSVLYRLYLDQSLTELWPKFMGITKMIRNKWEMNQPIALGLTYLLLLCTQMTCYVTTYILMKSLQHLFSNTQAYCFN